jgi:ketosteroid isomerase-like protein
MSTEDVLNHHLSSFGAGDVDQTMEDFTDDSVMILPDATLRGMDSIHAAFTDFYGGLFKPGTYEFTMDQLEVAGDIAYVLWHSVNEGAEVTLGTATFLVRDGKIAVQTFAALI